MLRRFEVHRATSVAEAIALRTTYGDDAAVYAGGEFTQVGQTPRWGLAALDATTGQTTDWDPKAYDDEYYDYGTVEALVMNDGIIRVGPLAGSAVRDTNSAMGGSGALELTGSARITSAYLVTAST